MPAYVRTRHPHRPDLLAAGYALEGAWRLLARACPVVVVGPDLARRYRRASAVLPAAVSLVRAGDVAATPPSRSRSPGEPFRVLAVGRLDPEKNPLLLADVLAALARRGVDARLTVCGTGTLEDALAARFAELGVADRAQPLGHVALDGALAQLYRESDALLHVSWTEGMPQVVFEAFAAGLPVVATAVGGVPEQVGDAAVLVPPGSAERAADALASLAEDGALGERLARRGLERVRTRTLEAETARVAAFIAASAH
jgi:glycosyltransferase involved in cell wall biosynthesis